MVGRWIRWTPFLCCLAALAEGADPKPGIPSNGAALSPKEELATFHLPPGFHAELVACEPNVVDPVAIAFDEEGRLFVAEMRGYPNAGVATGKIHSGKIKLLEDRDGDGFYEHSTTFAEGLRFPTAVMPWNGGILAAVAPDILYLRDTEGDGRADQQRSLYTGFNLDNIQQLINGLQWGLDNWVYGCAASYGGSIQSVEKPDQPPVVLRNRNIRFHPDRPGDLEPTSGGGQYGLAADDWQQWFMNTNSQHLRHLVLPDHYLRRNPALPVSAVTIDIPDHEAACKVYRISPFEGWRVERTRRRKGGPDAQRFPSTELVPGGYITSACSPLIYTADLFPPRYRGNSFICDPANNLVHRDILVEQGATFVAQRADRDSEFLASTDNWFRPVHLSVGPDGAMYVVDFYREVIETPLSLPEDIKKELNLESRGRGRIWRIVPDGFRTRPKPALSKASSEELVRHLADLNSWWRLTAQRLLIERQDKKAVPFLLKLVQAAPTPQARVHALWTLHGLQSLPDNLVELALKDADAHVREQGLRLAENRLEGSVALRAAAIALVNDPSPRVRFQLAFSLGEARQPEIATALANVIRVDVADPWTQLAALSSSNQLAPALLESLARDRGFTNSAGSLQLLTRLAALVGARPGATDLAGALRLLEPHDKGPQQWQIAILDGLGQGLENSRRSLRRLWEQPNPELKDALSKVRPFFTSAGALALDLTRPTPERVAAVRLLGYSPTAVARSTLIALIAPQHPAEIQLAAIRSLSLHDDPGIAPALLAGWGTYSPVIRREVLEALFAHADRLPALLSAIEEKKVLASQMEPFRIDQLRNHPDVRVRQRAVKLLARQTAADRQKVVDAYQPALALRADAQRGKLVFKKNCSTCHRLDNVGTEVGPDLLSALRNKTREGLLVDIFDPSREVDPRFINYVVTNKAGRIFTGLIAAETASSITLRRAERAEDTILRSQIDEIQATAKSLMPENLETQLNQQETADLIAYLQSVAAP
jgi:putative membrane-bound dehydrogenase-like protein